MNAIEAAASDMELRDKVARAMYDDRAIQMGAKHSIPWEYTIQQDIWFRQADAAIAAVQEAEADTITTLRAEVAALREGLAALLPDKLCGESWDLPDPATVEITITFGKLKAARALLETTKESGL